MILYGASGHAKVIIDALTSMNITIDYLFDDNESIHQLDGYPVNGKYSATRDPDKRIIISVGDNFTRKKLSDIVIHDLGMAVHKSAVVAEDVKIGKGSVVLHNVVIQPGTVVGRHVIINTKASVDHDSYVDDYVHIAPGATVCGGVKTGVGTFVGAGAVILPNITIGNWCTIGAGAVIIRDIPDFSVVVGNPGKIIKKNELPV